VSIEPLLDADGFRVVARQYNLNGEGMLSEELTLRAGTNLSGDECALLVHDASAIGG
jgi:hypothetical protein